MRPKVMLLDEITSALYNVKTTANRKQGTYLLKVFFDAKADEITKIYSDGFISNKNGAAN